MSRTERERQDAEKAARRARRLADRAEQRAQRKGEQAQVASDRAEQLAQRANRRRPGRDHESDKSIEDFVDDIAEKWSRKATDWLDDQSKKIFDEKDFSARPNSASREAELSRRAADSARRAAERAENYADIEASETRNKRAPRTRKYRRHGKRQSFLDALTGGNKKRAGHGLYRDVKNKKVCGVCAGGAEYLGVETWQVRMCVGFGLFFLPSIVIPGYFITWFLMDEKPYYREAAERYEENHSDEPRSRSMRKRKARSSTENSIPSVQTLNVAKGKFAIIESRLRELESHVTSSQFELKREFKKISGES